MKKDVLGRIAAGILSTVLVASSPLASVSVLANTASRGWVQISTSGTWKYYYDNGTVAKGWILENGTWYYLAPNTGIMQTGWLNLNGVWYFLNPVSNGTKGAMLKGWQWIDGYQYYLDVTPGASEGKLVTSGSAGGTKVGDITLEKANVNADGQRLDSNGNVIYEAGRGISTKQAATALAGATRISGGLSTRSSSGGGSGRSSSGGSSSSTRPGNGISSNGNTNNSSGGNSSVGQTNTDANSSASVSTDLVAVSHTGVYNLGYAQYLLITFNSGTYTDYNVYVDGVNVNEALTKVDDDGRVVKWFTTVRSPKVLQVYKQANGTEETKNQTVQLASGEPTQTVVVGDAQDTPKYIMTNGRVSVFDYYLETYDENGDIRVNPYKSTYSVFGSGVSEAASDVPNEYFVENAQVDAMGNGELKIKFALDENNRAWFEGINVIKVLNTDYNIVNGNVSAWTKEVQGNEGILTVQTGDATPNFRSVGAYYINIASAANSSKLTVPVELVSGTEYELLLNSETSNPTSGERISFNIVERETGRAFNAGLNYSIKKVTLTFPDGSSKVLLGVRDPEVVANAKKLEYSLIGNLFTVYGSEVDENRNIIADTVLTNQAGIYKVKIDFVGYKSVEKSFEVYRGQYTTASVDVDVYSSATGASSGSSSSGDGSSGGAGYDINTYLIWDYDLITNAQLLNQAGLLNLSADAKAVLTRYFNYQSPEAIYTDAAKLYQYTTYLNKVQDAKLENNEMLTFSDFESRFGSTAPTVNRWGNVKNVLENGKLGTIYELREQVGSESATFTGTTVSEGSDVVLHTDDAAYLAAIQSMYLDGNGTPLRGDNYLKQFTIDTAAGTITLHRSTLNQNSLSVGQHKLDIYAQGYKKKTLQIIVEAHAEVIVLRAETQEPKVGMDLTIKASANDESDAKYGDFLSKLTSVQVRKPDGSTKNVLTAMTGGMSGNDWYEIDRGSIVLKGGIFTDAGEYTIYLTPATEFGYTNQSIRVNVAENSAVVDDPQENRALPSYAEHRENARGFFDAANYEIKLNGIEARDLDTYLSALTAVRVNGTEYNKALLSLSGTNSYLPSTWESTYSSLKDSLKLTKEAFRPGDNTIVLQADGYDELSLTVNIVDDTVGDEDNPSDNGGTSSGSDNTGSGSGSGNTSDRGQTTPANLPSYESHRVKRGMWSSTYEVKLTGLDEAELNAYLTGVTEVSVNGTTYTKAFSSAFMNRNQFVTSTWDNAYSNSKDALNLTQEAFQSTGNNTIIVKATGYEDLYIYIDLASGIGSSGTAPANNGATVSSDSGSVPGDGGEDTTTTETVRYEGEGEEVPTVTVTPGDWYVDVEFDTSHENYNAFSYTFNRTFAIDVNGTRMTKESSGSFSYLEYYKSSNYWQYTRNKVRIVTGGGAFQDGANEITITPGAYRGTTYKNIVINFTK